MFLPSKPKMKINSHASIGQLGELSACPSHQYSTSAKYLQIPLLIKEEASHSLPKSHTKYVLGMT